MWGHDKEDKESTLLHFPTSIIYNPNKLEIAVENTSLNFAQVIQICSDK
jgi:hypothetical protein